MPRVVHSDAEDSDLEEIQAENSQAYPEALDAQFEKTTIENMQRVLEPFELATRNLLASVDYTKDEGLETAKLHYKFLGTIEAMRSQVENQTLWPKSGFGKLLKEAHSMRVTRLTDNKPLKNIIRQNACKCQVCGTEEHRCDYVVELCGNCDQDEPYNADEFIKGRIEDGTDTWETFEKGFEPILDKAFVSTAQQTKSMPTAYLGMFATGDTCLKRAMAGFQLQNLPMELAYRANNIAREATMALRDEEKNPHAMLGQEVLMSCDEADALLVLKKMEALRTAITCIDQGRAKHVRIELDPMREVWSQIDDAKDAVLDHLVEQEDAWGVVARERIHFRVCGNIAEDNLTRVREGNGNGSSSSPQHARQRQSVGRNKPDQGSSSREWGAGFRRKQPRRRQARKPAPQVARGKHARKQGGGKGRQSVLNVNTDLGYSSEDSDFVPGTDPEDEGCDDEEEGEGESAHASTRGPASSSDAGSRNIGGMRARKSRRIAHQDPEEVEVVEVADDDVEVELDPDDNHDDDDDEEEEDEEEDQPDKPSRVFVPESPHAASGSSSMPSAASTVRLT